MVRKILFITLILSIVSCGGSKNATISSANSVESTAKTNSKIKYEGGDGSSMEKAIVIKNAKSSFDGIPAEYDYLAQKYGKRGVGYIFKSQALIHNGGKSYDVLTITVPPSTEKFDVYFDITDFYGKF